MIKGELSFPFHFFVKATGSYWRGEGQRSLREPRVEMILSHILIPCELCELHLLLLNSAEPTVQHPVLVPFNNEGNLSLT